MSREHLFFNVVFVLSLLVFGGPILTIPRLLFQKPPGVFPPYPGLPVLMGAADLLWFFCSWRIWSGYRRKERPRGFWLILSLLISSGLLHTGLSGIPGFSPLLMAVAILNIITTYDRAALAAGIGSLSLLHLGIDFWGNNGNGIPYLISLVLVLTAVSLAWKLLYRKYVRQQETLKDLRSIVADFVSVNIRMQDNVDRTMVSSKMGERNRVAREIHDTVGHSLTALLLQLKAAKEIFRVKPEILVPRLNNMIEMVRDTLKEVRREVSRLRDERTIYNRGRSRWLHLCEAFSDSTKIRINTNIPSLLEEIDGFLGETIYRIIQEALTNAFRHGHADYVDVSMDWEGGRRILLRISDNGIGADKPCPGNGLKGIRERVQIHQGAFVWQTAPGKGFDIGVEIPYRGGPYG